MDRRGARAVGAPAAIAVPELGRAGELSDLASEVQCPWCGWCSRWPEVDDDRPTVVGHGCPRCGGTWPDPGGGPAPDVVVDAAMTAARRATMHQ